MSIWLLGWLGLGTVVLIYEIIAAANKKDGDTLSEQIWVWNKPWSRGKAAPWVRRGLFTALWVAGYVHFMFGLS